jgi:hypothetical protein
MKCKRWFLAVAFLLGSFSLALAQTEVTQTTLPILPLTPLRILDNNDVIRMHHAGVKPDNIITTILSSECHFDIFPPVLQDLKLRGVPEVVIDAMAIVPYGPPANSVSSHQPAPQFAKVEIPAGTVIEVEPVNPISTADLDNGAPLTFLVSRQVFVNNVLVIARGAEARARVVRSKRSGAWGRGGTLNWTMTDVVAVDGTRVPIQFSGEVKGTNRSTAVLAAAIITGAVIFPYTPPAGLVWALKKGENAVLYPSQRSGATVTTKTEVAGLVPEEPKVIYHAAEKLKAAAVQSSPGLPAFNNSFRPTSIKQP